MPDIKKGQILRRTYCNFDRMGACSASHGIYCKYRMEDEKSYGIPTEGWVTLESEGDDIQDEVERRLLQGEAYRMERDRKRMLGSDEP